MATARKAAKKTISKTAKTDQRADLAAKTASVITAAIAQTNKTWSGKTSDGKVTVHVHIGDVIMLGFDEAIDAEEWGMRENNTEITNGRSTKSKPANSKANATAADPDANRKISRAVKLKKGSLELNAIENSEPARKKIARKKVAAKKSVSTKRTSAKRTRTPRK